jgi:hypothetical protein
MEQPSLLISPPNASFWLTPALANLYGLWTAEHLASERGLIDYVLRFANSEVDLDFLKDLPSSSDYDDLRQFREATREAEVNQEAQRRALLMPLLVSVLSDPRKARAQFLPAAEALLTRIEARPFLRRKRRGASLAYRAIIGDVAALYAFVAILLLDEGRGLGRDLRRCKLKTCGRFFLVQPGPGRPRSRFCDDKCHAREAADRMRRLRAARKPK